MSCVICMCRTRNHRLWHPFGLTKVPAIQDQSEPQNDRSMEKQGPHDSWQILELELFLCKCRRTYISYWCWDIIYVYIHRYKPFVDIKWSYIKVLPQKNRCHPPFYRLRFAQFFQRNTNSKKKIKIKVWSIAWKNGIRSVRSTPSLNLDQNRWKPNGHGAVEGLRPKEPQLVAHSPALQLQLHHEQDAIQDHQQSGHQVKGLPEESKLTRELGKIWPAFCITSTVFRSEKRMLKAFEN